MTERIKQIPQKLLEFWNRYTNKQKTIIISVAAVVFLMIVILSYILSRPTYVELTKCEDNKSASDIISVLGDNSIANKYDTSTNIISVKKKDYQSAVLLMAQEGLDTVDTSVDLNWNWALDTSMSTTESDKQVRNNLALQNELRRNLLALDIVDDARVMIDNHEETYNILKETEPTSVTSILTLNDTMTGDYAQALAEVMANSVGNADTSNIRIMDSTGNLLFNGMEAEGMAGNIKTKEDYRNHSLQNISDNLETVLLKTGWDDAVVGTSGLQFNMDRIEQELEQYTVPEGYEQGPYKDSYEYNSQNSSGSGGTPGTDSNDSDTDYMLGPTGASEGKVSLNKYTHALNKLRETTVKEIGTLDIQNSSIAIVLTRFITYDEDVLRNNGTLDNMTFEEFMAANDTASTVAVDPEIIQLVSAATKIDPANISILGREVPYFQYSLTGNDNPILAFLKNPANVLMLALAALIIGLLLFVVLKGTAPVEVTEVEPELSVETILAGTKENQSLEDVEFSDKSESRKMIEKFVDENPEAVAQLLRNWLNEDWD